MGEGEERKEEKLVRLKRNNLALEDAVENCIYFCKVNFTEF